jgi:hypothetical protein
MNGLDPPLFELLLSSLDAERPPLVRLDAAECGAVRA